MPKASEPDPIPRERAFERLFAEWDLPGIVPPATFGPGLWTKPNKPLAIDEFIYRMTPREGRERRASGYGSLRPRDDLIDRGILCPYHAARAGVYQAVVSAEADGAVVDRSYGDDRAKKSPWAGAFLERVSQGVGLGPAVLQSAVSSREAEEEALEARSKAMVRRENRMARIAETGRQEIEGLESSDPKVKALRDRAQRKINNLLALWLRRIILPC
jgi:hypothetical protein